MMIRLIYSSRFSDEVTWAHLLQIVQHAKIKNEENNITGLLIAHNREILQVLEGEQLVVSNLFSTISVDERHHAVELMSVEQIHQRHFSRWKMKEVNIERLALAQHGWVRELLIQNESGENCLPKEALSAYTLLRTVYEVTLDS